MLRGLVLSLFVCFVGLFGGLTNERAHAVAFKSVPVKADQLRAANVPLSGLIQVQNQQGFNPLRGLFRALTGGNNNRARQRQRRRTSPPTRVAPSQPATTTRRTAAAAATPRIQKDPNAAKVLVIGDRLADGLTDGLNREFADDPMIAVLGRVNATSGLTMTDPYDWQEKLPEMMAELEPHLIVVHIGLNDRRDIEGETDIAAFGTPGWNSIYYNRVASLVRLVREKRLPVIWVGFAPAADAVINRDLAAMNERLRGAVVENGGAFIDIWRPFADENGNYSATGPDKRGQVKELRAGDGLTFSRDGYEKIAFFVGRPIRQFLGQMGVLFGLSVDNQAGGRVISLTRPVASETAELAGVAQMPAAEREAEEARRRNQEATVAFADPAVSEGLADVNADAFKLLVALVTEGDLPIVEGRADSFRAPLPDPAIDAQTPAEAAPEGPGSPFTVMPRAPTEGFEPSTQPATTAPPVTVTPSGRSRVQLAPVNPVRPPVTRRPAQAPGLPGVRLQ